MTNLHPFILVVLKNHVSWEQRLPLDVKAAGRKVSESSHVANPERPAAG